MLQKDDVLTTQFDAAHMFCRLATLNRFIFHLKSPYHCENRFNIKLEFRKTNNIFHTLHQDLYIDVFIVCPIILRKETYRICFYFKHFEQRPHKAFPCYCGNKENK